MQDILSNILSLIPDIYDQANLMAVTREWYELTMPHRIKYMAIVPNKTLSRPLIEHVSPSVRHVILGNRIKNHRMVNAFSVRHKTYINSAGDENVYNIKAKDDKYVLCAYLLSLIILF